MKAVTKIITPLLLILSAQAYSTPVYWTDWTTRPDANSAVGSINVGGTNIDVTLTSTESLYGLQTECGTNFWGSYAGSFTSGTADNAPTPCEMVQFSAGSTVTVSFSDTVENLYFGLLSWNGNTTTFDTEISIDSSVRGYYGGPGTPSMNATSTGFTTTSGYYGEYHGLVKADGVFDDVSFTHSTEHWHGFTVGIAGLSDEDDNNQVDAEVTAPSSVLTMLLGSALIAGFSHRKQHKNKA